MIFYTYFSYCNKNIQKILFTVIPTIYMHSYGTHETKFNTKPLSQIHSLGQHMRDIVIMEFFSKKFCTVYNLIKI